MIEFDIIRIKERRLAKKLTQSQLARQIGVTQPCVAQWERGKTIPIPVSFPASPAA